MSRTARRLFHLAAVPLGTLVITYLRSPAITRELCSPSTAAARSPQSSPSWPL